MQKRSLFRTSFVCWIYTSIYRPRRENGFYLREKIVEMRQIFGAIRDNHRAIITAAIESLVAQDQYVDMQSIFQSDFQHEDPIDTNIAHTALESLAPRLLEGIAISSQGSYILIPKVEVYQRASPNVDDCVKSTITVSVSCKSSVCH